MKAALFPGQGVGAKLVARALDAEHPRVVAASHELGFDLVRRIDQVSRQSRGILPTTLAQPGILVAGVVAYEDAVAAGESFDMLLGHSLGEYTALVAGGSIGFAQGVKLIAARAKAMQLAAGAQPGAMAAVLGLELAAVEPIAAANDLVIANDNTPNQAVVSGNRDALADAARDVRAAGGRSILLDVEGAFHSPAMSAAAAHLLDALMSTEVRNPTVPVVSNVTARPYRAPGEIRKLLVAQLTGRVRFREALLYLQDQGATRFVDVGPGDVVGRLARATVSVSKEPVDA